MEKINAETKDFTFVNMIIIGERSYLPDTYFKGNVLSYK